MPLDKLPNDIQIVIFAYLQPLDLLRLRKTCKALHQVTLHRIVWIEALRRVCKHNCIFMPTFPIEEMSQVHLEYAATGPERWLRNMSNASSQEGKTLLPCTVTSIQPGEDVFTLGHQIHLIPGGRYILIGGFDSMQVWDLGVPWSPPGIPPIAKKIAETSVPTYEIHFVHETSDGKGLLIFLCSDQAKITLYLIYPANKEPKLLKYAELPELDEDLDISGFSWSMVDNRLVFLLGASLNIWNYETGASASIIIEEGYNEMVVNETAIAVIYYPRVLVWAMPTLSGAKPFFPLVNATSIPPALSVSIPVDISNAISDLVVPSFWYSGNNQPLFFDIFYDRNSLRYKIDINEETTDATIIALGEISNPGGMYHLSGKFCNEAFVSAWTDMEARIGGVTAEYINPAVHGSSMPLYTIFQGEEYDVVSDFCPSSAQVVYVDRDSNINIMNFRLGIPATGV